MTEVRSKYHVAINNRGFMLRGAPMQPRYTKQRAPLNRVLQYQVGVGDLNDNGLDGSGWNYWTQSDWTGGFQVLKYKDDGSFRDGQAVNTIKKAGEVLLQYGWTSAGIITGSHSYGATSINGTDLLFGTVKSGAAKLFKLTSANVLSTLSAYAGISAVNSMDRFNNNTLVGLTRTSGSFKTLSIYKGGTTLSGFRSTNPIVRAVKTVGIRAYISEYVAALSGDVLSYATNLSAFTSAYQAGKNRKIQIIEDLGGYPYFFIIEGRSVEFFRYDEVAQKAFLIYTWENLTNFGVHNYLSTMIITGTSNNKKVAFAFNGAKLVQIFDDQLLDTSYDFSKPFEFEGNLQLKGATWDGQNWFPGLYGKFNANNLYTPFINFTNKAYGYFTSGTHTRIGYQDPTKYNISGNIVSSEFGGDIGGVDKLVNSVDISMNTLATGETIEIYKSVDGGSSFTSIGKASYAQDGGVKKKTLFFPSGYVTKLWNYKAVLCGPGTSTPSLGEITHQYRTAPNLKKTWVLSIDAGDNIITLDKGRETRDGKSITEDLWLEMEAKRTVKYEDVNAFEVSLTSAMSSGATSARVSDTRLMPPRGRMRVLANNIIEEMTYTSADGGKIKGISRAQKNTLARAYGITGKIDNFYNVLVTNISEQINDTDQNKTESICGITLLEV